MPTYTNQSKNSSSWTDQSKNNASWSDQTKNSVSFSNQLKDSASFTNQAKNNFGSSFLLKEDSFYLLLETGDKIILEDSQPGGWAYQVKD